MNPAIDPHHQNNGRDWTDTYYDLFGLMHNLTTQEGIEGCMNYIRTKAGEIYKTLSDQHTLELLYMERHLREISSILTSGFVTGNSPSGRVVYDGFCEKLTSEEF